MTEISNKRSLLRGLVNSVLTDEKIRCFCYDASDFRQIYDQLTSDTSKSEIVEWLIRFVSRKGQFERLADLIKAYDLVRFEAYRNLIYTPQSVHLEKPYGTIHPRSVFYVERPADRETKEYISNGHPTTLIVQAPGQMGKSSLLQRTIEWAQNECELEGIVISFEKLEQRHLQDEEAFFKELCWMISDELAVVEAVDQYWRGPRSNTFKCTRYLTNHILPQCRQALILALDEAERVLISPFRDDFFRLLQSWDNERVRDENLHKLTLLISRSMDVELFSGAASTELFEYTSQLPFYKLGTQIVLYDFVREEIRTLNKYHALFLDEEQIEEIMDLVGGHPFLVRMIFYSLTRQNLNLRGILAQAMEDKGAIGNFLQHRYRRIATEPILKETLRMICQQNRCEENQAFYRLRGAGLIKKEGSQVFFRNKLYELYFQERLLT